MIPNNQFFWGSNKSPSLSSPYLYALSRNSGIDGIGSILRLNKVDFSIRKMVDFSSNAGNFPQQFPNTGNTPQGTMCKATNGKFYGGTIQGGTNNVGTIFEYDPVTNILTKKIDLASATGSSCANQPIQPDSSIPKLYGLTSGGGTNSFGVIYEYDYSTNTYTKKIDFTGNTQTKKYDFDTTNGAYPYGSMIAVSAGLFYGMTSGGGTNSAGVIFEYNAATNTFTKKFDMVVATGSTPKGSLFLAADGNLYGTTIYGGTNGVGVIFKYEISTGIYTVLKHLVNSNTELCLPNASFVEISNGNLVTKMCGGGSIGGGGILKYNYTTGVSTILYEFTEILGARLQYSGWVSG